MNFLCHLKLSNIRVDDNKKRGIPHGYGFDLVSSANYMWESLSWIFFTLFTESGLAGCFTVISFI